MLNRVSADDCYFGDCDEQSAQSSSLQTPRSFQHFEQTLATLGAPLDLLHGDYMLDWTDQAAPTGC